MSEIKKELLRNWIREHTRFRFVRASGPGGQNVNKVNTKAEARLSIDGLAILSHSQKEMVRHRLSNRINRHDEIVISSQRYRTQYGNREASLDRLEQLLAASLKEPKRRAPTRPTRASKEKRLQDKKKRGQRKKLRKSVW